MANSEEEAGPEVRTGWFTPGDEYGFRRHESGGRTAVRRYGGTEACLTFTDAASMGARGFKSGLNAGRLGTGKYDDGSPARLGASRSPSRTGARTAARITVRRGRGDGGNGGRGRSGLHGAAYDADHDGSLVLLPGDGPGGTTRAGRDTAGTWLGGCGGDTAPSNVSSATARPRPGPGDPFARLMFDQGTSG